MPLVTFLPDNHTVSVKSGVTVLSAALRHRIPFRTRCGGQASCLMCKVLVLDESSRAALSAPNPREERRLGDKLDQGYRLACQALIRSDATITIPEDPLKAIVRAKLANMEQEDLW
jgi:2Fe-2S ferredoxin